MQWGFKMGRYTDYNGSPTDYDLDDPDPFTEKRQDRYWEHQERRKSQGYNEDDFDGDWDD